MISNKQKKAKQESNFDLNSEFMQRMILNSMAQTASDDQNVYSQKGSWVCSYEMHPENALNGRIRESFKVEFEHIKPGLNKVELRGFSTSFLAVSCLCEVFNTKVVLFNLESIKFCATPEDKSFERSSNLEPVLPYSYYCESEPVNLKDKTQYASFKPIGGVELTLASKLLNTNLPTHRTAFTTLFERCGYKDYTDIALAGYSGSDYDASVYFFGFDSGLQRYPSC